MNGDMFEQLIESVTQADDIIKGKAKPFRATEFAEPQVKAIRAKTGLSQTRFADVLGVSKRTLENWWSNDFILNCFSIKIFIII